VLAPTLTNSKFKQFQRKSKRFSGLFFNDALPLNIYFCRSLSNFYISMRHIDLIVRYLKRKLKKSGVLVFPTPAVYPLTKKPTEVRMGKGKGGIVDWAIPLKKGSSPFLFQGKKTSTLKIFLKDLLKKLPIKSRISESKHLRCQLSAKTLFFSPKIVFLNTSVIQKNYF
jgi:large subunit ribosomal protein L16